MIASTPHIVGSFRRLRARGARRWVRSRWVNSGHGSDCQNGRAGFVSSDGCPAKSAELGSFGRHADAVRTTGLGSFGRSPGVGRLSPGGPCPPYKRLGFVWSLAGRRGHLRAGWSGGTVRRIAGAVRVGEDGDHPEGAPSRSRPPGPNETVVRIVKEGFGNNRPLWIMTQGRANANDGGDILGGSGVEEMGQSDESGCVETQDGANPPPRRS